MKNIVNIPSRNTSDPHNLDRYYECGQRQSFSANYVVTLVMPTDIIGLIIGKQGSALRDITAKSGARILIQAFEDMPPGSNEREVSVSGSIQEISIAEELILQRLKNRRPKCDDNNIAILENGACLLKCVIPRNLCGLLIGRGGVGVKEINEKSGAWVKVAHEQDGAPGTADRTVYITGTFDQVFFAKSLILSRIDVGRPIAKSADESNYPDTLTVEIPCRAAGYLLKKGGSGLKEIMDQTGAHLKISSLSELEIGENVSRVIISGEQTSQRTASELVKKLVDEWILSQASLGIDTGLEETSLVMAVPSKAISGIMDENKRFIKNVQMQSGASMKVLFGNSSTSITLDHQVVILMGPLCTILVAQELLLEEIRRYSLSGLSQETRVAEFDLRDYYRASTETYLDQSPRQVYANYPLVSVPSYAGQPDAGGQRRIKVDPPAAILQAGIPRAYYQPPLADYSFPSSSSLAVQEQKQRQQQMQYVLPFGYYPSPPPHGGQEAAPMNKLQQERYASKR